MFFSRKKETVGVYLIHGFTDTGEYIYKEFVERLKQKTHFDAIADNLQGHNSVEDLVNFRYNKCIDSAEKNYQEFAKKFDQVYLVGFSMGGVIASYLASKYKCDKLVLLAPAFKYLENTTLSRDFFDILGEEFKKYEFKDIFKPARLESLQRTIKRKYKDEVVVFTKYFDGKVSGSFSSYINFMLLVDKLKDDVEIGDVPTRIYIGEHDELVPIKSASFIYNKISSKDKRMIVLPHVYHDLMHSSLKDELQDEIIQFLKENKKK